MSPDTAVVGYKRSASGTPRAARDPPAPRAVGRRELAGRPAGRLPQRLPCGAGPGPRRRVRLRRPAEPALQPLRPDPLADKPGRNPRPARRPGGQHLQLRARSTPWRSPSSGALFGEDVRGYHVVQALAHALAATLLAALLRGARTALRGRRRRRPALPGAPGQRRGERLDLPDQDARWRWRSPLGALLLHPRRPALALLLFALALLTKASAAFALPMAVVFSVARARPARRLARARARGSSRGRRCCCPTPSRSSRVLGRMEARTSRSHPDPWVAARSVVAIAGRYLAMALLRLGRRAEPRRPPARLAARPLVARRPRRAARARRAHASSRCARRREEAAWWIGAAAAWLPIAQIGMSFIDPMADRYLYFALPGLIGGCAFAARDAWRRARRAARVAAPHAERGARAGRARGLGWQSHEQARVWRSAATLALASAARYPDGLPAQLLARSARRCRATRRHRRGAARRRRARLRPLRRAGGGPVYEVVRRDPAFQQLLREMAQSWVEQSCGSHSRPSGPARARGRLSRARRPSASARRSRRHPTRGRSGPRSKVVGVVGFEPTTLNPQSSGSGR